MIDGYVTYEQVIPPMEFNPNFFNEDFQIEDFQIEDNQIKDDLQQIDDSFDEPTWIDDEMIQSTQLESSNNNLIQSIINTGKQLQGHKYKYGGTDPNTGMDCSAFIQYIFNKNGIKLPRTVKQIEHVGKSVAFENMKPGDLICSVGSGDSGRHIQMVSKIDGSNIYVLEAKDRNNGIGEFLFKKPKSRIITIRRVVDINKKDPLLVNQDIQAPKKFKNKEQFVTTLNQAYKKALIKNGFDPNYSEILVSQAAFESGWGNHQSGKNNFSGIKALKGQEGTIRKTKEYSPSKGYYVIYDKFRDFNSIDDYADFKVKLLSNNRYNIFGNYNPYDVKGIITKLLKSGYGTAPINTYTNNILKIYNTIQKYI